MYRIDLKSIKFQINEKLITIVNFYAFKFKTLKKQLSI